MKKIIFTSLLFVWLPCLAQINWKNYSTSFTGDKNEPSLGIAIPYNGISNNFEKNVVGISHWNVSYGLNIDTALNENIPVYFVYDTAGVYILAPFINEKNVNEFEVAILLNNKTPLFSWAPFEKFTTTGVGNMDRGIAISGSYSAKEGQYLAAHIRNKNKEIISSLVIYFRKSYPFVKLISTSDNATSFSQILNKKPILDSGSPEIGWHRQYSNAKLQTGDTLQLSTNEKNILIELDAMIYKKEAVEYELQKDGKITRHWGSNEYDNKYILLKDLLPGHYTLRIRYKRQRESITELKFNIHSIWYKTAAFKAAIVAFVLVLIAAFYFLFKYLKQKQDLSSANKNAAEANEKLQGIHARLNPHFTFNALGSIQGMMNKGDVEYANKYLTSFAELLRETISDSRFDQVPLQKELNNLAKYITLEQLRNNFEYQSKISDDIPVHSTTIPPFILQPFVENAIKHGLPGNSKSILTLDVAKQNDSMVIAIADNGSGFNPAALKEGNGLKLSKKRIALLNKGYGEDLIELTIESSENVGTQILISFKNWL